ncbi:MAG: Uma2 family endonuclease [Solirubrobacteraceae bacterium]|nr:Uma2 family endonuclease [Solirubrobacteraceae bacterium]
MNTMQVAQRLTADEYLALETDWPRTWLVDGEVVVNQPRLLHQVLHGRLFGALDGWVHAADRRGLAVSPLDVLLDDRNVYAPDLLWYRADRAPAIDADPPYPLPDIAVEIRSPSTWRYDIGTKKRVYEEQGLPELWLVDGDAAVVLAFRRSTPDAPRFDVALELDRTATLSSPQLPGFALDVGALFESA